MKLWILEPMSGAPEWRSWYDKAFGFVVRAETEQEAREFAAAEAGEEAHTSRSTAVKDTNPWLDATKSTCEALLPDGPSGVVMRDFARA